MKESIQNVIFANTYTHDAFSLSLFEEDFLFLSDFDLLLILFFKRFVPHSQRRFFSLDCIVHHTVAILKGNILALQNTVRAGWILASLSLIAAMFSVSVFYGPRKNFTAVEAAVYSSLHRAFWSAGTGWVVLACVTDNAGKIIIVY